MNRVGVIGGAAFGLVVGLVAGMFRDSYWETVAIGVTIGAVASIAVNVFATMRGLANREQS